MKKQNWLYGLMIAVTMLMCGSSFASPQFDGIYSEPIYDTVVSMATDGSGSNDTQTVPCAKTDNSKFISMACRMSGDGPGIAYLDTVPKYLKTVLACGLRSKPIALPDKVPVAI